MNDIINTTPPVAGFVKPSSTASELNDQSLKRFLQQIVVGIVGLLPTTVFPRWQSEPPDQPDFTTNWAAIGEIKRERDTFAAVLHNVITGAGVVAGGFGKEPFGGDTVPDVTLVSSDAVVRNQIIEVLCSFYGPDCEANSELFTMGLSLAQNREVLSLNGFALVEVGDGLIVPALIKERWVPGVDVSLRLRRQQVYVYPVPNLQGATIGLIVSGDKTDVIESISVVPKQGQ